MPKKRTKKPVRQHPRQFLAIELALIEWRRGVLSDAEMADLRRLLTPAMQTLLDDEMERHSKRP